MSLLFELICHIYRRIIQSFFSSESNKIIQNSIKKTATGQFLFDLIVEVAWDSPGNRHAFVIVIPSSRLIDRGGFLLLLLFLLMAILTNLQL
jgi:hypothetical protein